MIESESLLHVEQALFVKLLGQCHEIFTSIFGFFYLPIPAGPLIDFLKLFFLWSRSQLHVFLDLCKLDVGIMEAFLRVLAGCT